MLRIIIPSALTVSWLALALAAPWALLSPARAGLTHGPMLGNLTSTSVRVWARLGRDREFRVVFSERSDLRNPRTSASAHTQRDRDFTATTILDGLKPNTKYYYALDSGGLIDTRVSGRFNSFTTLPHADAYRHPERNPRGLFNFRFEHGSCASQNPNQHDPTTPAYATMLRELKDRIYFRIMNGDWLYEELRDTTADQWARGRRRANGGSDRPPVVDLLRGITGVWENYKLYLSRSKNLANWHREMPFFITFDDHEILNDVYGCGEVSLRADARRPQAQGPPGRATHDGKVERAVFRDPALRAWQDYLGWANPHALPYQNIWHSKARLTAGSNVLIDTSRKPGQLDVNKMATLHVLWGHANTGVYEVVRALDDARLEIRPPATVTEDVRYSIGALHHTKFRVSNCEFFLLDTRSHRTLHNPDNPRDSRATLLGKRQLQWLMDSIKPSDADFLFVVSSVTFSIPHVGSGGAAADPGKDDAWTAFLAERESLIAFLESMRKPVFLLTGDLHNCFVVQVAPSVWEMSAGPHNSTNHRNLDAGGAPASGWFDSRGRRVKVRWSTTYLNDVPRNRLHHPNYCVVQVNNVYNSPDADGRARWVAYPHPSVTFSYYDGLTGDLKYAESVSTMEAK